MTVSSSTNRVSYSGNGTLTTFAYTFKVFDQGDLTVILRSSTGTETVQTITTHYTVTGVGDAGGGNVVFVTAPSATETVVILREQDLTQGLDLVPNDPFPAQSLEESLDKLTFMVQQHEEELGRAIKASRTNTLTGSEFTISAADRANKVFAFDSSGDLSVTQELGTFKGNWAASTAYVERDLVKDTTTNDVFIVNSAHTSSGSLPLTTNTNSAKYDKIIDISNPPGDLTVGGNISTSGSVTAGSFVIGSADINENDLEAIDSVTAGTVAASKAVVVDVNKDISSFRNLTATGDITFGGLSDGTITVTAFVDEDNMASDSATLVPTQQSVKAYVDAQVATADALSEVLGNGNTTGGTNLVISSGDTLDVDGALDASGTISLGGNFPTGTDNVALGSSALGAVVSAGERNTIIGSAAGDGITNGDDNTALGAGALGSITTQSSNTAVGRNALTSTTGTANTALGNGAGSQITSGQYNTVLGLFNGNQNSLDIRTSSNNVVLSDGQGNVRFYANSSGNVGLGSVSPDAELHISSSSSTPKIIIENSTNPRGNFIGSANNGDLVLGADEDSLSGSSAIRFKVDGTEVMSLDYQGTLALTGNATFGDNDKAIFGAGSDLQIYHDGSNSFISDQGTGNLKVLADDFRIRNAADTDSYIYINSGADVGLTYAGASKLATTSTGVDITGTAVTDGVTSSGNIEIAKDSPQILWNDTAGGTQVDYSAYANGGAFAITDVPNSYNLLTLNSGSVSLAYQSTVKLATTSTGVDITGTLTSDGLTVDGNPVINGTSPQLFFQTSSASHYNWQIAAQENVAGAFEISSGNADASAPDDTYTKRLVIQNTGDISFYEDTGTTAKFFWDASAESLGIGTTSPAFVGGGNPELTISGTISYFNLQGNRTAGAGNTTGQITNYNGSTAISRIATVLDSGTTDGAMLFSTASSGSIAERMRIDSSGQLLIGKTTTDINTIGTRVSANGKITSTRQNDEVMQLNRQSSDGDIVDFRKDGTTVGSIGARAGDLTIGTGNCGLIFNDGTEIVIPANITTNAVSDANVDLGYSAGRFKDLYLSGGVYLGGTGSANKLDDYEEGTWTPALTFGGGNTGLTYNTSQGGNQGQYVKIGKLVYVSFSINIANKGTSTGNITISGLPFNTTNTYYNEIGGFLHRYTGLTGINGAIATYVSNGPNLLFFHPDASGASTDNEVQLTNSNVNNNSRFWGTLIYTTAS